MSSWQGLVPMPCHAASCPSRTRLTHPRRMEIMRVRALVLAAALLASSGISAFAQTETGRILGTVTDPQARVVPGVTVSATNNGTGAVRSTVTDVDGKYVIANVQPAG